MLLNDYIVEDNAKVIGMITRNKVTWAICQVENQFAAYPEQNYVNNYGEICRISHSLSQLKATL